MQDLYSPLIEEVLTVAATALALPADSGAFRMHRMERLNWRALRQQLESGDGPGLPMPLVILHVGAWEPEEIQAGDMYAWRVPVSIWYVVSLAESDGVEEVESKLDDLKAAFLIGGTYDNFQLLDPPSMNSSTYNAANEVFLHDNYPYLGGVFSFTASVQG